MYPPVDYPVSDDDTTTQHVDVITIAALRERYDTQQSITDAMIQSAHASMEAAQQLPSAAQPGTLEQLPTTPIFKRLLSVIR